jgi:hypothetical protein
MSAIDIASVKSGSSGLEILVRVAWDKLLQLPGVSQSVQAETTKTPKVSARKSDALTSKEWKAIERLDRQARGAIADYRAMRADHYDLRQTITAAPSPSGLRGFFASKSGQRKQIEKALANSLEDLRAYFQKNVQPWLRRVWTSYTGKSFTVPPGANIPTLLKLASLPKEKEGKVISVEYLKSRIEKLEAGTKGCNFKVGKHTGPLAITMTRKIGDGPVTTLRFEQRRPGVVNVFLNDKRMVFQGKNVSLYTDDALKLAGEFARGSKSMKVRQGGFKEYVIGSEAMFVRAQQAMEKAEKKA